MIIRWLLPLGFLGLIAIAVLLVIYLLKPQYKEKRISSTKIWKRVLLHSKKQHLILSNVFIFLVQAFVLAIIAVGFAQPRFFSDNVLAADSECVLIIDVSASMRAKTLTDGSTRFERAVSKAKTKINEFFAQADNGSVSVILSSKMPKYLFTELKEEDEQEMDSKRLRANVKLAENRLNSNPYTKILLYTDTQFGNLGSAVETINVADKENEQNVAILGCTTGIVDNEYVFEIVFGAYGDITRKCNVFVDIKGANNGKIVRDFHLEVPVTFSVDTTSFEQVQRVAVTATNNNFGGQEDWFFDTYDEVKISIQDLHDSIADDNQYYVYSGIRDKIKTEYWSKKSNSFWQYGFNNLANNMVDYRDMTFREIYQEQGMKAENSGYDFYIFEHSIPEEIFASGLPLDGVTLIVDPDETLNDTGLGLTFDEKVTLSNLTSCTNMENHPLMNYMDFDRIHLTQFTQISIDEDSEFEPILFVDNSPVMLVKNLIQNM